MTENTGLLYFIHLHTVVILIYRLNTQTSHLEVYSNDHVRKDSLWITFG